jgi:hypothetical protein
MKPETKRLIKVIVIVLIVGLILNAIFTWGICFEQSGGFWSVDYIFEDIFTEKQTGSITMRDDYTECPICIPGIFYIYRIDPPPYIIRLDIDDETESLEKIFIELISIEYVDGQKIEHNINWERKFKNTPVHRFRNSKLIEFPAMRFSDKLPVTVDRRQSCRIRFVGYFVNKEGDKISFDTPEYFEYEPHEWRIYPLAGSF